MRDRRDADGTAAAALGLSLLLLVAGCTSPIWMAVDARPAESRVTIRGTGGEAGSIQATPGKAVELRPEADSSVYVIDVEPPDTLADRYESTTLKLTAAELRSMAAGRTSPESPVRVTANLAKRPLTLLVTTRPSHAVVAVRNSLSQPIAQGAAPLAVSLIPASEDEQLTFEVRAAGDMSGRYETKQLKLSIKELRQLSTASGEIGRRRLEIDLDELPVPLVIEARPGEAKVTVKASDGSVLGSGPAPLQLTLAPRPDSDMLQFEIEPTGSAAARYRPHAEPRTFLSLRTLPQENGQRRKLAVTLKEQPFVLTRELVTFYDPQGRLRGVEVPTRAYREITELSGAVPTRVVEFDGALTVEGMDLSPDDQRLAFSVAEVGPIRPEAGLDDEARDRSLRDEVGYSEVAVQRATLQAVRTEPGGGVSHITTDRFRDRFPAFTADGKWLLFASDRRRRDGQDILRVNAEQNRGGIADIYVDQRGANVSRPSHAANDLIAFSMDLRDNASAANRHQIWTVGGPNQFPSQITLGTEPSVSPDGTRIAYIGADGNLWVIGFDGVNAAQLTFDADRIRAAYLKSLTADERALYDQLVELGAPGIRSYSAPSWSADGRWILFTAMEGNDPAGRPNEDIWIMHRDGTAKQQLTTNGSADKFPHLSSDGRLVYFMSNRGGHWAIWRIALTRPYSLGADRMTEVDPSR